MDENLKFALALASVSIASVPGLAVTEAGRDAVRVLLADTSGDLVPKGEALPSPEALVELIRRLAQLVAEEANVLTVGVLCEGVAIDSGAKQAEQRTTSALVFRWLAALAAADIGCKQAGAALITHADGRARATPN